MRAPPPKAKGVVNIEQIVDTLPDRGRSCWHLGAVWALSQFQDNEVRLNRMRDCAGLPIFNPFLKFKVLFVTKGSGWTPTARNPDFQGWRVQN